MLNRRSALVALAVTLVLAPMPTAAARLAASAPAAPGCSTSSNPAQAARELLHPKASLTRVDFVRGHETALVAVPIVLPHARHRLVRVDNGWCDATAGFNATRSPSPVEAAAAFASMGAARYFDGVTVRDISVASPGIVTLTTHAKTNGVVADWRIVVDKLGVRDASWTAKQFAVAPFEASLYGPTAFPGATVDYRRAANGLLAPVSDPLTASIAIPVVNSSIIDMSDGFRVVVSRGHAPFAYSSTRTGVAAIDVNELAVRTTKKNYEDFLSWGLEGGWSGPGHVFIDGGLSAVCAACVLVPQAGVKIFNVHMTSTLSEWAADLGYTYPDPELFFSTVMGHEIFHNFQVANGSHDFGGAFVEGAARFQETLHDYSHVSHQPKSIVSADGDSGCNGYIEALDYPLNYHLYDACFVWMSMYADHGLDVFVNLVRSDSSALSLERAVERVTGVALEKTMSKVATRALTGQGLIWGPAVGSGPSLDWSQHLRRWEPATLATTDRTLSAGSIVGGKIIASGPISLSAAGPTAFTVVRRSATGFTVAPVADGEHVNGPADGETVWFVAANGAIPSRVKFSTGLVTPPATGPLWTRTEAYSYKSSALLPTGTADASATADHATKAFDLSANATGSLVSYAFGPSAGASAYQDAVASVVPGEYEFVAIFDLDKAEATGARGTLGNASSNVRLGMSIYCARTSCYEQESWYAYSADGPVNLERLVLRGNLNVDQAQDIHIYLSQNVGAYSTTDKSASAALKGRITEFRMTRGES